MKPNPLNLLLNLAQKQGKKTTIQLSAEIGVSQQTVSRWLFQLQEDGLVEKTQVGLRITNKALETLSKLSAAAEQAKKRLEIHGIVVEGLKDGVFYMLLEGYRKQIKQKLGFDPFPGTLNLRLTTKTDLENNEKLQKRGGIKISGFKDSRQKRLYGGARVFKTKINDLQEGAIIIPDRTHHDAGTLEIIAPAFLRKALGLKNGAAVRLSVLLENE
jgi:riboflavin kinase